MKTITILLFSLCNLTCLSQIFYKSAESEELINLRAQGITYIRSRTELDQGIEKNLKEYWKCTNVKIMDPEVAATELNEDDIILSENRILNIRQQGVGTANGAVDVSFNEDVICLYTAKRWRNKETISKNNIIGYVSIGGYNQGSNPATINFFMPYTISGLNTYVDKMLKENISGLPAFFNSTVAESINSEASQIKGKTLILVGNTIGHVILPDLVKEGVKYEYVSEEDLKQTISNYETDEYYLLFFSTKSFTNVSIYKMNDKNLVYTWFYSTGNSESKKFDKKDLKRILK